ncbi:peptidoglycan-binding protein [Burkholderia sp. F1]|uniref:peptidoglycan-binding protein n=1 Tax=Burkholderia sp. F1 TaxID=3366817 RepID=UPI003D73EBFB
MELSDQGRGLLKNLRHLFVGNHAREEQVVPTSESAERYLATAYVVWRFEHDVATTTSKGNASISGGHFGYNTVDFQNHLRALCEKAVRNRDIRVPFMQRIDIAGASGLELSSTVHPVHDFGSYSVFRQCGSCSGSGEVSCGGCSGRGRHGCASCGGLGSRDRTVTHTRWNGNRNETYTQTVRESCGFCMGSGRVVCARCGGSGTQTCSTCAGHGFLTDVARVQALARPSWHVPAHSGLAADALVRALDRGGPTGALRLVPFELAGTGYNDSDNWVARYEGAADVVELGLNVVRQPYKVAAVGSNIVPIVTPPVFDQLLRPELERIASLSNGRRGSSKVRRQAKNFFSSFRELPVLDRAMRALAKLDKMARANPEHAVASAAEGFITKEAAVSIGGAFLHILDKVSPPNSRAAWALVAAFPAVAGFILTADSFTDFSLSNPWSALLPLAFAVVSATLAMLLVSPAGWVLSAMTSALLRRKVPIEYRQRGRNWAPLKGACVFSASAAVVGALYGAAGAMQWVPTVRAVATPAIAYAMTHTATDSQAHLLLAKFTASGTTEAVAPTMSGDDVRRAVQRQLIMRGYLRGPADGKYGPRTVDAIVRYEQQEHLNPALSMQDLLAYMTQH